MRRSPQELGGFGGFLGQPLDSKGESGQVLHFIPSQVGQLQRPARSGYPAKLGANQTGPTRVGALTEAGTRPRYRELSCGRAESCHDKSVLGLGLATTESGDDAGERFAAASAEFPPSAIPNPKTIERSMRFFILNIVLK